MLLFFDGVDLECGLNKWIEKSLRYSSNTLSKMIKIAGYSRFSRARRQTKARMRFSLCGCCADSGGASWLSWGKIYRAQQRFSGDQSQWQAYGLKNFLKA